jgi:hypothetical protein
MARTRRQADLGFEHVIAAVGLICLTLVGLIGVKGSDWWQHKLLERVKASTLHLTSPAGGGVCSGFVIAKNRFLTAFHCSDLTSAADGKPVKLLAGNPYYDIAFYEVETAKRPLHIAEITPMVGDEVTSVGYGWGQFLIWHHSEVEMLNAKIQEQFVGCMIHDREDVGGMSGGPVFDINGDIVSIVSRGSDGFACGITPEIIRAFLYEMK